MDDIVPRDGLRDIVPDWNRVVMFHGNLEGIRFRVEDARVVYVEKYPVCSFPYLLWRLYATQFFSEPVNSNIHVRLKDGREASFQVPRDILVKPEDDIKVIYALKDDREILYGFYHKATERVLPAIGKYFLNRMFLKKENQLGVLLLVLAIVVTPLLLTPFVVKLTTPGLREAAMTSGGFAAMAAIIMSAALLGAIGKSIQFARKPSGFGEFMSQFRDWLKKQS